MNGYILLFTEVVQHANGNMDFKNDILGFKGEFVARSIGNVDDE